MLTLIWSATDIIFCYFRPFFALFPHYWPRKSKFGKNVKNIWGYYPFTHEHHKSRSYDVWFLRYKVWRTIFFVILGHFLPFDHPNNPKNQNFEKIKKSARRYIISQWCTTNDDHICMVPKISSTTDTIFCHFGLFFALLLPNSLKNENIKKWKKLLEKSSVYASVPKILIIGYTVHEILHVMDVEIWHVTDVAVIFHFRPFFALLSPSSPKNQNFKKNEKKTGEVIILKACNKNYD